MTSFAIATDASAPADMAQIVERMRVWALGGRRSTADTRVIVCESADPVSWLASSEVALGDDDVVFIAMPRRNPIPLPEGPQWFAVSGATDEPGAEIDLGNDVYVQTVDYSSLRYLSVVGPTIVRITGVEDARELSNDVRSVLSGGSFPEALMHPLVELGDGPALQEISARGDVRALNLSRLHIDREGALRTSPFGDVVGRVGDDLTEVQATVATWPHNPALSSGTVAALEDTNANHLRFFIAGLSALRVLHQRTQSSWRVLAWPTREDQIGVSGVAASTSCLLLTDGERFILHHIESRRAFTVNTETASLLAAWLTDGSANASGTESVLRALANRGLDLRGGA